MVAGVDLRYISEQLGHASIGITSDLYARFARRPRPAALEVLDDRQAVPAAQAIALVTPVASSTGQYIAVGSTIDARHSLERGGRRVLGGRAMRRPTLFRPEQSSANAPIVATPPTHPPAAVGKAPAPVLPKRVTPAEAPQRPRRIGFV